MLPTDSSWNIKLPSWNTVSGYFNYVFGWQDASWNERRCGLTTSLRAELLDLPLSRNEQKNKNKNRLATGMSGRSRYICGQLWWALQSPVNNKEKQERNQEDTEAWRAWHVADCEWEGLWKFLNPTSSPGDEDKEGNIIPGVQKCRLANQLYWCQCNWAGSSSTI